MENDFSHHRKSLPKEEEISYFSILPTATQYARNAIFSGMMPLEMQIEHPELWVNENETVGKNLNESHFSNRKFKRME